jgi:hypothetical protein
MRDLLRLALCALILALAPAMAGPLAADASGTGLPAAPASPAARARFPVPERMVYSRTVAGKQDSVEMNLTLRTEGGRAWYELVSRAPDQDAFYRIDPANLEVMFSDVTTRGPSSTIRRTTTVIEDRAPPSPGDLVLSASETFILQLRRFDFSSKAKAKVGFQGSAASTMFSLEIGVAGRETVTVGGKDWDCWKLQLGASGIIGGLVGKSSFWVSTAWPNLLVRSEGASGPPGSPVTILELASYSQGPAASPPSPRK